MEIELVFGVTAGVVALISRVFTPQRRYRRKLRRAQLRKIAEVEEDKVARIVGKVRAVGPTLVAPLSQRACVCFVAVARRRDNQNDYIVARGSYAVPFVIEDETGRALVTATDAQLALDMNHTVQRQLVSDLLASELRFVQVHGGRLSGQLDLEEGVIQVGDMVAVLGSGTREPDPDAASEADYRSAGQLRLCLTSSSRYPLVISNEPDTVK